MFRPRQAVGPTREGVSWDHGTVAVPLVNLSIKHGRTRDEASHRLDAAVQEVSARFGAMIRRVEWAADRSRVRLEGVGFWAEMWVDAEAVHATGDAPILGRLFGGPLTSGLKQIVERTFQKRLP
jgi:Putative polyhydroxyalkanoic acid system protein (PHA_gran_rgn)